MSWLISIVKRLRIMPLDICKLASTVKIKKKSDTRIIAVIILKLDKKCSFTIHLCSLKMQMEFDKQC